MSVLSTGQPKIEIAKLDKFDNIGTWKEIDIPKEGTTTMETSEGETTEFRQEGGGLVDIERKESTYSFTFDLFVKKGFKKPIDDINGVIVDNYALRMSPKDKAAMGLILYKCQVSCVTSYAVADGMICKYNFSALQTDDHEQMMEFYIEENNLVTDVNFVDIPSSGESLTATVTPELKAEETVTATVDSNWFTATVADNGVVTVTAATENKGKRREGWLTIKSSTGKSAQIRVNQLSGVED